MDLNNPILDADRAYAELLATGTEYADKNAAANLLEELRRSVLSELKLQAVATSDAGRETEALASQTYRDHVTKMVEARRQSDRAKCRYDSVRVLAEMRRTEESSRRAELALARSGALG